MKGKYNFIVYIGAIICSIILFIESQNKIFDMVCGIIIGMHIMLLIDSFYDFRESKKQNECKWVVKIFDAYIYFYIS